MPLRYIRDDLTRVVCDAIVNSTNTRLRGRFSTDGAIHRAAGPRLSAFCEEIGYCAEGDVVVTPGFDLPCRYIIHTVGPCWSGGDHGEREALARCYTRCLEEAEHLRCRSVAFPLLCAGSLGFPRETALDIALDAISAYLAHSDLRVLLVLFDAETAALGRARFPDLRQYIDDRYADARDQSRIRNRPSKENRLYENHSGYNNPAPCAAGAFDAECELLYGASDAMAAPDSDFSQMLKCRMEESFQHMLLRMIDERKLLDAECYKRANLDRRHFSKIRSDPEYQPSKATVLALAIGLQLNLSDTNALLKSADFTLTHSDKRDIIIEYMIERKQYSITAINLALHEYRLQLLGAKA